MSTLTQMIEDVRAYLRSYTRDQELSSYLTAELSASGLTLNVGDSQVISRGRIEIDSELLWVQSVDRANNAVTLAPYGRGMDGTTPAIHALNSRIIVQPLYPRQMVKDVINQVITGIGGQLYGVDTVQITSNSATVAYEVPEYTQRVLSINLRYDNLYEDSEYARRWKFDPTSSASSTGKMVYIYDRLAHETPLDVTVERKPLTLSDGQSFEASLLPSTAYDVVVLGAAARLMATSAAYMTSSRSIEASQLDQKSDSTNVLTQARFLQSLYLQRLEEEKANLLSSFVSRSHYTG
jgi:hypothetical protein